MPTIEKIYPEYIRLDGGTQPREKINQVVCNDYGERMKAGEKFPPVDVFYDGESYWLADGFHRVQAYMMALPGEAIECNVFKGSLQDAQWHSYSVNKAHGLRRTNPDKQKAVIAALGHPKGRKMSDTQIAEHIGVSHSTVAKYRDELESTCQIGKSESRTGRDGRTINTANIGRKGKKRRPKDRKLSRLMESRIAQPTRTPKPMQKMTALNMPHDPFMGAMTLIEVFDVDYLRGLLETISKHLKELKK